MATEKIRFGVVGTNFITDWVLKGALQDPRFELAAVYSRTEEKAREFAGKYGAPHIFTDLEAMAGSPYVDAVYVASPNAFHAGQAILCMNRGKHVLCEKAFASNVEEVRRMIAVAKERGVVLMEAMKPTLTPGFLAAREHLPEIGQVRRYFASYCQYSSRYDKLKEGVVLNAFDPAFSNGSTMDIGIYTIYPMVVLFGRPKKVSAAGIMLSSGVDGQAAVNFEYEDMTATVIYGKIADSALPSEIQGEEGTITIDRINQIDEVRLAPRGGETRSIMPRKEFDDYHYEVAEFIDIVQSGRRESSINSLDNSLATMEILCEIRRQLGVVFPADS